MNLKTKTNPPKAETEGMFSSEIVYTAPSAKALNAYQANLMRWVDEAHEEYILTDPAVAEGIAETTSVIERWRESLR